MSNLEELIVTGRLGRLTHGATIGEIVSFLGEPEIHTRARKSYPEMLVYGDLEFRLRGGRLYLIALNVNSQDARLPTELAPFIQQSRGGLTSTVITNLLDTHGVAYVTDPVMSSGAQTVLITSNGVHLSFDEGVLRRIGVTFPVPESGN